MGQRIIHTTHCLHPQNDPLLLLFFLFILQQSSQYPAYVLSAASVVPGAGVVVGTSSGSVYLVKRSSIEPQSLSTMDSVPGQVSKPILYYNFLILL